MFNELNNNFAEFDFDWADLKFRDISELDGRMERIRGLFIKKDATYGNQPVIVTATGLYSISRRYLDSVKTILDNADMVKAVNAGKLGAKIKKGFSEKYKKDTYYVTFCDIDV